MNNFFSLEYSLLTCYDDRVDCITYEHDLYCEYDPGTQAECKRYCGLCSSNNLCTKLKKNSFQNF